MYHNPCNHSGETPKTVKEKYDYTRDSPGVAIARINQNMSCNGITWESIDSSNLP